MSLNITVMQADASYSESIKRIISNVYVSVREKNIQRFGPEITGGLDMHWQMPDYNAMAEKSRILVASVDGKVVGFTAYRVLKDIIMTDYTVTDTAYSYDEVSTVLYSATLKEAKDMGCKYAKVHTVTDGIYSRVYGNFRGAGYETGLESIMYYMPLSARVQKAVNNEIVIVPAAREHIEDVMKMTVMAWTPIRLEQKKLLGDRLYTRLFDGWEERKRLEVKNDFLAGGVGGCFGYAALIDGKVAGFVTRLKNPAAPYMGIVGNNAVNPEFAGKGIGSAMYSCILSEMEKEGMTHVGVYTGRDAAHAPARRAYERAGFTPESAIQCADYYKVIE